MEDKDRFVKLFEPLKIGTMEVPNRIVMPPMATCFGNPDGTVSDRIMNYYVARAKGGVGLIIVEASLIAWGGRAIVNQLGIYNDSFIPSLRMLTRAVHHYGTKIAIQLHHAGRQTRPALAGMQPVAPSPLPSGLIKEIPRELTIKEIESLVDAFSEAAGRAREAEFDAVEFHGAHGYLIDQFLSSYSNKRADRYGGGLEERMRFALEIVERSRKKVGTGFPLFFRMSADEFLPGGLTLDETKIIAFRLKEASIDCLHVSAATYETLYHFVPPYSTPPGSLVYLAQAIKEGIKIPVIAVGRINTPELAEQILSEGKADLVSMGRALIADPELPNKAREGRSQDIRPCTACLHCIDQLATERLEIECALNPTMGMEEEGKISPALKPESIIVVGSGPAGMEAAKIAAARGHSVTLFDQEKLFGGQMLLAKIPPYKENIQDFINFQSRQLAKMGVEVRLGSKVNANMILDLKPDAVVVATGSTVFIPNVPGVNLDNVCTARDVLAGKRKVGDRVVIIGGGEVGLETAEFLANQGKEVTVVEMLERIAHDMGTHSRWVLLSRLRQMGVILQTKTEAVRITPNGVVVSSNGHQRTIESDSVVLAAGVVPNDALAEELKGKVKRLYLVGDCSQGRRIIDAVRDGYRVGREI